MKTPPAPQQHHAQNVDGFWMWLARLIIIMCQEVNWERDGAVIYYGKGGAHY